MKIPQEQYIKDTISFHNSFKRIWLCSLHKASSNSRVERKTVVTNIFLKPLFRGNFDPFVNNSNLGAIAHTSNGT